MFIHSVYFWLPRDITSSDRETFDKGVAALCSIPGVRHGWAGPPASTNRPVIDRTYDCGLVLVFDDKRSHDAYQEHPVHDAFRKDCERFFNKVAIYDMET